MVGWLPRRFFRAARFAAVLAQDLPPHGQLKCAWAHGKSLNGTNVCVPSPALVSLIQALSGVDAVLARRGLIEAAMPSLNSAASSLAKDGMPGHQGLATPIV